MRRAQVRGGLRVRVRSRSDATMEPGFLGKVVGFDPEECGATPRDPMVMVRIGRVVDGFWLEELRLVTE